MRSVPLHRIEVAFGLSPTRIAAILIVALFAIPAAILAAPALLLMPKRHD